MGTETLAEGGEKKPAIKNEGGIAAGNLRRGNYNNFNKRFVKKEKFLEQTPIYRASYLRQSETGHNKSQT